MKYLNKTFTVPMAPGRAEPACAMCGQVARVYYLCQIGHLCPACYEAQKQKRNGGDNASRS
jgi:hypothetical protein